MNRLLDTNVCIDVLRGRKNVVARISACSPKECFISVITEFELFQGAARAPVERRTDEHAKVARLVSCLPIVPFDSECARIAAQVNADLLHAGTPVSITDVFIAATALRHGWPVVTNNKRDFQRISGLTLEDWR
ncbi:type II toxin-antitoxin system VapC family toxin [Luteolibacter sp. LG18]|uniref:type II toxin-antitoxin system VapC family toxin n=1 Tax=Luteolibacter sp. LG18 TaxID=2819286 RepID=UPI002B2D18EB|nr:ribonuclease VapC [Luteolibacter sp. LG18]